MTAVDPDPYAALKAEADALLARAVRPPTLPPSNAAAIAFLVRLAARLAADPAAAREAARHLIGLLAALGVPLAAAGPLAEGVLDHLAEAAVAARPEA